MIDHWWQNGREEQSLTQSLRCYAPDELQILLQGTGLRLASVESRGAYDAEKKQFIENTPVEQSMMYLATLKPSE
jgi:hypothetical protein